MICYLYRYIYGGEQVKKELERLAEGWAISKQCFGTKSGARKGAFTLAEVLITLGIIGVVAALTLPSLIQKYQEQVLENQLKKMYSTISQGIQKAMADDGVYRFSDTEFFQSCIYPEQKSVACAQMVKKYFNVAAVKSDRREYYDNVIQVEYMDGREVFSRDKSKSKFRRYLGGAEYSDRFMLSDGSEFSLMTSSSGYFYINVDTNGEKGPNTDGLDIFGLCSNDDRSLSGEYINKIQKNSWKFPW